VGCSSNRTRCTTQSQGKRLFGSWPLNVPRFARGAAGPRSSRRVDDGKELAAQFAEAIFSPHLNVEVAKAYYDDVKTRMRKYGRDPDHFEKFFRA